MGDEAEDPLANMAWFALTTTQADVAQGSGLARRYQPDVSVFAAIADDSPAAWADLGELVGPDGIAVLFRAEPVTPPLGWASVGRGTGHQMVLTGDLPPARHVAGLRDLGATQAPQMRELVALTEPGPFRPRTHELGGYVGIEGADDAGAHRLLAMAGQRMRTPEFTEISAVCTHPDARRRGYAEVVTGVVARRLLEQGVTPMLHVAGTNVDARRVYERMGFTVRRTTQFTALRWTPAGSG
ncbi:MAG: putative acetyltransferase [Ilumatobacteraceae bacterium]|jgi:ribosomal protein S18 acetylase RimI-like enzyme|nr:putative acetyltransferase [Ilumatobacteraceae bacterium]